MLPAPAAPPRTTPDAAVEQEKPARPLKDWERQPGETEDEHWHRLLMWPYRAWGIEPPGRTPQAPAVAFDADIDGYVGRQLRYARQVDRFPQATLAAATGITQTRLSRIERAEVGARIGELVRLAIQLQRSLDWFVTPPKEDRADIVLTGWERVVPQE